ncbi:MAG: tyrosine-type recombinase/integrase [Gammaproteobacteria bacterium]|nr:tyrosine-type recombinase/integrase [Gammaproteobacteria bacterium]
MLYQREVFNRYFTEPEEKKLFKTIAEHNSISARRDLAWMKVLRHTGIRIESFSLLTRGDAKRAISEKELNYVGKGRNGSKKAGRSFVNKTAVKAFKELLRIGREMGVPDMDDKPLVVSRQRDNQRQFKALTIRSYQVAMQKWCTMAQVPSGSPHWLRHTTAKRIMKSSTSNDPRGIVQAQLNHSDPRSTYIYTMPDKEDIQNAMEEIS